jgi:hypothetical protein
LQLMQGSATMYVIWIGPPERVWAKGKGL